MNNSPILDFSETAYEWWNTYNDIFWDKSFIHAVEDAIQFLNDSDQESKGETYGDKIRFIFSKYDAISALLKSLRASDLFKKEADYKKAISLVLVIEDLKEIINNYPTSVQEITSYRIANIVDQALNDEFTTWDDGEIEEIMMSSYKRLETLLGMGFPTISTEWDIVMFCEQAGEADETVAVWDYNANEILTMDRNWYITFDDDNEDWKNLKKKQRFIVHEWWKNK